jgi:hypothetical protein
MWAAPAFAIGAIAYVPVVALVPWKLLVSDQYQAFTQPLMVGFARRLSGTLDLSSSAWALLASLGATSSICGAVALCGLMLSPRAARPGRQRGWFPASVAALGAWVWFSASDAARAIETHPLRSAPLVLLLAIGWLGWRFLRGGRQRHQLAMPQQVLLLVSVFGLVGIARVVLNVSLLTALTPFTLPPLFLTYLYLLLRTSPRLLLRSVEAQEAARRTGLLLTAVMVAGLGLAAMMTARSRNVFEIDAPRGRLLTTTAVGRPLAEAIRLAATTTTADEYVLSVPQATIINFLAERPYPLREENLVPGYLTPDREAGAIHRILERNVRLVFVANIPTQDYGSEPFGVGFNQALLSWITANYFEVGTFGPPGVDRTGFGDQEFFIRVYRRE